MKKLLLLLFLPATISAQITCTWQTTITQDTGQVTLTWLAPDPKPGVVQNGYRVFYGSSAGGPQKACPEAGLIPVTDTSVEIINLIAGSSYYFVVNAVDDQGGYSPYSNHAYKNIYAAGTTFPDAPTDLSVTCNSCTAPPPPPPSTAIYDLPTTDFNGTGIPAVDASGSSTWSVPGASLIIEAEIFPRSWPDIDTRIISKTTGSAEQDHVFMLSMINNNQPRFRLKTAGFTSTLIGNTQIPLNQLTTIRAEYDGTTMAIYVNGQLDVSVVKSGNIDTSNAQVQVGSQPDGSRAFDGTIKVKVEQ